MANDIQLKIGADNSELVRVLEGSRDKASEFASSFSDDVDTLGSTLGMLNRTLEEVAANTQRTADATQHLSTLTDLFLVFTGLKLVGDLLAATASGVMYVGEQATKAAVSFNEWAQSQAYVTGQTNAVRVANDEVSRSFNYGFSTLVDLAGGYVLVRHGITGTATALSTLLTGVRAITTALATAGQAAASFAVELALQVNPLRVLTGVLAGFAYAAVGTQLQNLFHWFGQLSTSIKEYFQYAEVYNSTQLQAASRTIALAGAMSRLNEEMLRVGFDSAKDGLASFMSELMHIPGMTKELAASIEASFATIPNATGELNASLVQTIRLVANTSEEAKKLADSFVQAFGDPETNGEKFLRSIGNINPKLLEAFDTAKRTGDVYKMQSVMLDGNIELTRRARDEWTRQVNEATRFLTSLGMSRDTAANLVGWWDRNVAKLREMTAEANTQIEKIIEMRNRLQEVEMTQEEIRRKAHDIAQSYATPSAAVEKLTSDIRFLKAAAAGATTDVIELIKHYEGFTPKAKKDSDGLFRVGYGSDTVTDESGRVRAVTEGMVSTQEDALRDLQRRVAEYQRDLANAIGEPWQQLPTAAQSAITSVAYNYAQSVDGLKRKLPSFIEALKTGDRGTIASYVQSRAGDNDGVNANRRIQEASIIRGEVKDQKEYNEALGVARSRLKAIEDVRAGGSVTQKTEIEIARAHAQGIADEVAEHQRLVEALKTDLTAETDVTKQQELRKRISSEESQLRETEISRMRSQAELEAAAYDYGTEERYNILKAELDKEMALREKEPDKLRELERRKIALKDEFDYQTARTSQTDEEGNYQERINKLREEATVYRELAATKQIDGDQLHEKLLQNLKERENAEREHWERIKEIWEGVPSQYDRAQKKLVAIKSKTDLEIQNEERRHNQETFRDYESTFRSIYSSISSSLVGVLTKQQTFAQGMRSVMTSMLNMVLQKIVEKAAAWSAAQAMELARTTATEGGKTAVVATGETARTGLVAAGGIAQLAARGATMLKSVLASAAETFAGVFAFLSPVMGPAAAGPAAASEATVAAQAAVAAFDIGAWNIPQDQLAVIHRREMVMPAAEADAFRRMLQSGAPRQAGDTRLPALTNARGQDDRLAASTSWLAPEIATRVAASLPSPAAQQSPASRVQAGADLTAALKSAFPASPSGLSQMLEVVRDRGARAAGAIALLPMMGSPATASSSVTRELATVIQQFGGVAQSPSDPRDSIVAIGSRSGQAAPSALAGAFAGLNARPSVLDLKNLVASNTAVRPAGTRSASDSVAAKNLPSAVDRVTRVLTDSRENSSATSHVQFSSELQSALGKSYPRSQEGLSQIFEVARNGAARTADVTSPAAVASSAARELAAVVYHIGSSGGPSESRDYSVAAGNRLNLVKSIDSFSELFDRRSATPDAKALAASSSAVRPAGSETAPNKAAAKSMPSALDRVTNVLVSNLERSSVSSATSHVQFSSELRSTLEKSYSRSQEGLSQLLMMASGEGVQAAGMMAVLPKAARSDLTDLRSFHSLAGFVNHTNSPMDGINSYAIGAWNLPQDQLAFLHRRELVMPASEAGAFRSLLGATSPADSNSSSSSVTHNHHYAISPTINAVDAKSVARLFSTHSGELMRAFAKGTKLGQHLKEPALRPA